MPQGPEKILIVDDEPSAREIACRALGAEGYQCIATDSAYAALSELAKDSFALVLADIKIPGINGTELLRRIVVMNSDVQVIMMTASAADRENAIEAMKAGASDYLMKPLSIPELLESVRTVLEKRRLLLENRIYQLDLENKVGERTQHIRTLLVNTVTAFARTLEARDRYTKNHSEEVAEITTRIAHSLGLQEQEIANAGLAGLLHDIGKVGVPDDVLNKPGRLTKEEFAEIMKHPELSQRILEPIGDFYPIIGAIRHHHERYDGGGYPDRISGERIPLMGRILAVADAYNAMTSNRPYREAFTSDFALEELVKNSGKQFDPAVVHAFLRISDPDRLTRRLVVPAPDVVRIMPAPAGEGAKHPD